MASRRKALPQPERSAPARPRQRPLAVAVLVLLIAAVAGWLGWQGFGAYEFRAAGRSLASRDFAAARQHAARALRVWPADGQTLLLAAQAARRDGAEADRLLDAAERAGALREELVFERGLARLQAGDLAAADECLEIARQHPASWQAPLILEAVVVGGLRVVDLPRTRTGLDLWDESRTSAADRTQGLVWRGELAVRSGDVDTATDYLRQATLADPARDDVRLRLAGLLVRIAPREALAHLVQLQTTRPDDRDVLLHLARCRRSLGEYQEADRLLARLVATSPNDFEATLERGLVALDLRDLDEAEHWLRKAVQTQPPRRDAILALARCLQAAGKTEEAAEYREQLAQLDALLDQRAKDLAEKGRLGP